MRVIRTQEAARTALLLNGGSVPLAIDWLNRDYARQEGEQSKKDVGLERETLQMRLVADAIKFLRNNPNWDRKVSYDLVPGGIKE